MSHRGAESIGSGCGGIPMSWMGRIVNFGPGVRKNIRDLVIKKNTFYILREPVIHILISITGFFINLDTVSRRSDLSYADKSDRLGTQRVKRFKKLNNYFSERF